MKFLQNSGILVACFILCLVDSRGIAGNVKLIAMNGNQYWFSSSSPYAPNLNFHLAYQYCRTLGLQLVVLEGKEEVETISAYLNSPEGATLNQNKYWTSGNKLGADSWIWMSSGEQLNSSFSDSWLKNPSGSPNDNLRSCMSMKAPITKKAIFMAEECNKSLPFICEQVRCLYYNYPVMMFPDPSDLRADIEDGTVPTESVTPTRFTENYLGNEKIRTQNFISASGRTINSYNKNNNNPTLTLSDMAAQESNRIDPNKIQRRITLRPVMTAFPYPPSYINSFYKYKTIDYTLTSTSRPSFKKTTRETLWGNTSRLNAINPGPTVSSEALFNGKGGNNHPTTMHQVDINNTNNKNSASVGEKSTTYITGKVLKPSNSTVATTVETSIRSEQKVPDTYTHFEVVTSKSTSIDGEEVTEAEETEVPTTLYSTRYGTGSSEIPLATDYVTTNPSVVFDDEQNNVGGEIDVEGETEKPVALPLGTDDDARFFEGNGIRRPDTTSSSPVTVKTKSGEDEGTTNSIISRGDREVSQTHSPATMKLYQFQRNKSPINWARDGRSTVTIIASSNAGPGKIGLGPRLKFRNRN